MRTRRVFRHWLGGVAGISLAVMATSGAAAAQDWAAIGATDVVVVVTRNQDGSDRETKVWIVELDDRAYIRTAATRWYGNVEREPDIVLRVGEKALPLRAVLVTDALLADRVEAAFREKYGFWDAFMAIFRFGEPHVMRLEPRA
jgi:hypothetical protein